MCFFSIFRICPSNFRAYNLLIYSILFKKALHDRAIFYENNIKKQKIN